MWRSTIGTTDGRNELLSAVMADLLRRQVTMITAIGNSQVEAAKAATTTIPIVFLTGEDPVKIGFVASLNKPGVNTLGLAVGPKRLELLRELLPAATNIALLVNPTNPISTENQTERPTRRGRHARAATPCPACQPRA